jgi:DNA topoisomerase VI subunit A
MPIVPHSHCPRGATHSSHHGVVLEQVRKTTITTRVLELIHQVVSKRIHITKRDLFYTDVKLFSKQEESDAVLDDIACMVGCTRTSLNVVASDKVITAITIITIITITITITIITTIITIIPIIIATNTTIITATTKC